MIECQNPIEVAKEMFWLAWKACDYPIGLGVFCDKSNATKEDIWNSVTNAVCTDYVYGRMMKMYLEFDENGVVWSNYSIGPERQSWARVYPTYQALFDAAIKSLS